MKAGDLITIFKVVLSFAVCKGALLTSSYEAVAVNECKVGKWVIISRVKRVSIRDNKGGSCDNLRVEYWYKV